MPALFFLGKFVIAFPFMYHLFNGMRHLIWDGGYNVSKHGIKKSAVIVAALTLGSTLYLTSL